MRPGRLARRVLTLSGALLLTTASLASPAGAAAAAPHGATATGWSTTLRHDGVATRIGRIEARTAAQAAPGRLPVAPLPTSLHRPAGSLRPASGRLAATHLGRLAGTGGAAPAQRAPGASSPRLPAGPALATPSVLTLIDGVSESNDGLGDIFPESAAAANGSYVVQATSSVIRMYNRAGTTLVSVPSSALFGLDPDMIGDSPQIAWDPAHGRWVGVMVGFVAPGVTATLASLTLIVSESSDPTGAWDATRLIYTEPDGVTPTVPDQARIASTSDTIVLTAEELSADQTTLRGGSVVVLRWSDILAGGAVRTDLWTAPVPEVFGIVPAVAQGPTSTVRLAAEQTGPTPNVLYASITGTALASMSWLSYAGTILPFCATQAPRQPGAPGTIANAVDERPMSAAWRGGLLAISSTCLDTGDDYVRITMLDTSTAVPTPGPDALVGAGGGADSYAGGVGFTRNGALVIAYTESSTTEAASTWVVAIDGVNGTAPVLVAGGGAHQNSTYWARSVVVATDPIGTDTVWIANQLADPVGSWDTRVARVAVDPNPPTVTAPVQTLIAGSRVGAQTVPVRTSWSAADTGTGIARIDMAVDVAGHGLVVTGVGGTASSTVRNHVWRLSTAAVDDSYQYAATAWDLVWNSSATALGAKLTAVVYRETTGVTYHGTWHAVTGSSYLNGAARYASTAGAYASFKTSGRSFALVTTKGPTRGKASIYVDGKLKATITLKASATSYRNLAYVLNLPSSGTHTIKLVVVSGRVDVDGFVVLR